MFALKSLKIGMSYLSLMSRSVTLSPKTVVSKSVTRRREEVKLREAVEVIEKKAKDTFGSLSAPEVLSSDLSVEDDDDGYDKMERMKRRRPLKSYDYVFHSLKHNGGPNKLKNAIKVYEQMKYEDNYEVEKYHYTLLISSCAEFGLVDKAFYFFQGLLNSGRRPTRATITSLINACAEAVQSSDLQRQSLAIEKLSYIVSYINDNSYVMNTPQFNSLVKAYARLGDFKRAFDTMKIMMEEGVQLDSKTFAMLLNACITDRVSGFSHAIRIMKEVKKRNLLDIHHYNLFVRCIRDCGVGSANHLNQLLQEAKSTKDVPPIRGSKESPQKQLTHEVTKQSVNLLVIPGESDIELNYQVLESQVSQMNQCPEKRLLVVGGVTFLLNDMKENRVIPTATTLTTLLPCIPDTNEAEEQLVNEATKLNVRLDADFFNMIIKRRGVRNDLNAARQVLLWMQERHLSVDIVTFGVLSLACTNRSSCLQLLTDMKDCGFSPNIEILGALIRKACHRFDYTFLVFLLKQMESKCINPDPKVIQLLEKCKNSSQNFFLTEERKGEAGNDFNQKQKGFDEFKLFYKSWLKRVRVEVPRREQEQFDFEIPKNPRHKMYEFEKEMKKKIQEKKFGPSSPDDEVPSDLAAMYD
jgi:pentatricopeptide repeat domain-containing protein 1